MKIWHQSTFQTETESRHLASEPHMRIQVMRIDTVSTTDLFDGYHGELLIMIWSGNAVLRTAEGSQPLKAGDQCMLVDGEPFKINPEAEGAPIVVQMIWSPGTTRCEKC